jgi:hypothetical protein
MKSEQMDFVDWLHKIRREAAADRRRRGISGTEWLRETRREAELVLKRYRPSQSVVARHSSVHSKHGVVHA